MADNLHHLCVCQLACGIMAQCLGKLYHPMTAKDGPEFNKLHPLFMLNAREGWQACHTEWESPCETFAKEGNLDPCCQIKNMRLRICILSGPDTPLFICSGECFYDWGAHHPSYVDQ